jgi:hypothetical protein
MPINPSRTHALVSPLTPIPNTALSSAKKTAGVSVLSRLGMMLIQLWMFVGKVFVNISQLYFVCL